MFKIFNKVKDGISSFIKSSVEYEEADQDAPVEPKKPEDHVASDDAARPRDKLQLG